MKEMSDLVIGSSCQATSYTRVAHRIVEHPLSLKVPYFTELQATEDTVRLLFLSN